MAHRKEAAAFLFNVSAQTEEDDEILFLRLQQSGDRKALEIIFMRHARLVMAIGMRILHNKVEAEDLVHDVFLRLLEKIDLFDPSKGSPRNWLVQLTHYQAIDRLS